jgi:uncharacterized protein YyaL (SSP411 family)
LTKAKANIALFAVLIATQVGAATPIAWQTSWGDTPFAQAAKEHKFVLLDLHAVWCHWCHVMDDTTYADDKVRQLINAQYIAVSVDADSDPDLSARYGDWGWPATIVLAADGTEIVKRRGYLAPQQMASLLQAIIDDPSPGPSVQEDRPSSSSGATQLSAKQQAALRKTYVALYDDRHGGWGQLHKLIDAESMELAFVDADSARAPLKGAGERRARQTLDNNLLLIDPVWGGVYQYSDAVNWRSPHFEKLMSYQADDLRLYSEAYARWHDPRYLAAANSLFGYIDRFLSAPDGGFYVSQDADVSREVSGRDFYSHDDATRRQLGMPAIDTHEYSRETGWAIRALAKFYDVTGSERALGLAEKGGRWALANRKLQSGGFRHDSKDRGGPYLDDNISIAQGFVALYRSTGDRAWLREAVGVLQFIEGALRADGGGYFAAPAAADARGVFGKPVRQPDQNAALARVANWVSRYSGDPRQAEMATHAIMFLSAAVRVSDGQLLPGALLANQEATSTPIHIAIVGAKWDPAAQSLHRAALRYPADYLQVDWLDRAEGNLPNPEIEYPDLDKPAAFACANGACSSPVFQANQIERAIRRALLP